MVQAIPAQRPPPPWPVSDLRERGKREKTWSNMDQPISTIENLGVGRTFGPTQKHLQGRQVLSLPRESARQISPGVQKFRAKFTATASCTETHEASDLRQRRRRINRRITRQTWSSEVFRSSPWLESGIGLAGQLILQQLPQCRRSFARLLAPLGPICPVSTTSATDPGLWELAACNGWQEILSRQHGL